MDDTTQAASRGEATGANAKTAMQRPVRAIVMTVDVRQLPTQGPATVRWPS